MIKFTENPSVKEKSNTEPVPSQSTNFLTGNKTNEIESTKIREPKNLTVSRDGGKARNRVFYPCL